ncbi:MAG: ABC transporter permease [Actinobacteria bacterium]|nr:ABC transporter permease [Actinomycetota bacterium]
MKIALRELRRRPGRFATATVILTLIALLLLFLGGLLDGLIRNSTGAVRAQQGGVVVSSAASQSSFLRSRIDPDLRARVAAAPGVEEVGGLGIVQLGARVPGNGPRDLADVALFGVEIAPRGVPNVPDTGEVWADRILEADGVRVGTELLLGPARSPVVVVGFVEDTNYLGQAGLWGSPATWRSVVAANRPAEIVADGVFQSLVVRGSGSPVDLAAAVDAATGGATLSLTIADTANAIPGVAEQRGTFNQIIGVTVAIAIVVIALFFALLTVERVALYGVLKAIGARSRTIFAGLVVQAIVVTVIASTVATVVVLLLDAAIPPGSIPVTITVPRIVSSVLSLLVAAVAGSAFSLRRVLRVDPASAIGSSS